MTNTEYQYEVKKADEHDEWLGDWRVYKVCSVGWNCGKSELVADFETEAEAENEAERLNNEVLAEEE